MKVLFATGAIAGLAAVNAGTLSSEAELEMIAGSCEGNSLCEEMVMAMNGTSYRGSDPDGYADFRRLKNLKALILWLQPEHRFARYCFYGCYCMPDQSHDLYTLGYGKPVDNIDNSCRMMGQCYECARMDHEPERQCDPSRVQYNYDLDFDEDEPNNHQLKSITCTDNASAGGKQSCRRAICECDRKLAYDLREYYSEWHEGHHTTQGTFIPEDECLIEPGSGGSGSEIVCCGTSTRFPYKTMNGNRSCCGDKTYDTNVMQCCDGDTLQPNGMC